MIKIYHNPRCSKSRQALKLLQEKDENFKIVFYMDETLTAKELSEIICLLNIHPTDLLRKGEAVYKENYKGKELTEDEWIEAMISHPKLIERPIVVKGQKATIGRPPERILDII